MPPFVNTECKNCNKLNRFDLAELRKEDGSLVKVCCIVVKKIMRKCSRKPASIGRKFKFTVKGGADGAKK